MALYGTRAGRRIVDLTGVAASATTITAAGLATGGGDLSANRTITVTGASQAEQEAGSSTAVAVTPGVQQHHQSAAKAWGHVALAAGAITAQTCYNATVTRSVAGQYTITYATPFSSAAHALLLTVQPSSSANIFIYAGTLSATADTVTVSSITLAANNDPVSFSFAAFGDQ
jgi:hypothetical protein